MRRWHWVLLAICLVIFGAQAALSARSKSATFDEQYHITRGYAYLRSGDFHLSFSHPPLVNLWSALPLLSLPEINLPTDHPSWPDGNLLEFADEFLWRSNENGQQMVALARLPVILLGIALMATMFVWTRQLAGVAASWVVLLLAIFDPNLLAHSRLATNDLGLACFLLLTLWRLWCWLEQPSPLNLLWAGLFAGATMATKFSGLLVWPIVLTIVLVYPRYTHRRLLNLVAMGLIALFVLWAVYRFDFGPLSNSNWPILLPAPFYFSSLWTTFVDFEEVSRPAFLLGQVSDHGWWYYFPVALLAKSTIPLLLFSVLGIIPLLRRNGVRRASVLWVPILFFLGMGMTGRLSIGFRHILPAIPFMIMIAGHVVFWADGVSVRRRRAILAVVGFILFWHAAGVLSLFPHFEAYFNEAAGGPAGGHQILVDSNLDWGQDLPALKQLLDEKAIDQVSLSYFGTAPPEQYGINYRPLPSFPRFESGMEVEAFNPYTPPPGWYAISATSLRLGLYLQERDLYAFFQDLQPTAQAGYSINLYEVTYPPETTIVRDLITNQPVWEIPEADHGLMRDQRLVVKWRRSEATDIFWPPEGGELPPGFQPMPADFGDAFSLLGYAVSTQELNAGEALQVTLVWRVGTAVVTMPRPTTADPLAAFIHLAVGSDPGNIVAQYDGWETALTGLEPGDMIVQRSEIQTREETPAAVYQLWAGLYSPQSGRRLPANAGHGATDSVKLTSITVLNEQGQ